MMSAIKTECFQVGHLVQQGNRKDSGLDDRWISKLHNYAYSLFLAVVRFGDELPRFPLRRAFYPQIPQFRMTFELTKREILKEILRSEMEKIRTFLKFFIFLLTQSCLELCLRWMGHLML